MSEFSASGDGCSQSQGRRNLFDASLGNIARFCFKKTQERKKEKKKSVKTIQYLESKQHNYKSTNST
jgi:hypothetical protein